MKHEMPHLNPVDELLQQHALETMDDHVIAELVFEQDAAATPSAQFEENMITQLEQDFYPNTGATAPTSGLSAKVWIALAVAGLTALTVFLL